MNDVKCVESNRPVLNNHIDAYENELANLNTVVLKLEDIVQKLNPELKECSSDDKLYNSSSTSLYTRFEDSNILLKYLVGKIESLTYRI